MTPLDSTRRTIRTVVQTGITLAAALPGFLLASGVPQHSAVVVASLGLAAGVTRVMQAPQLDTILAALRLTWLMKDPPKPEPWRLTD